MTGTLDTHLKQHSHTHTLFITSKEHDEDGGWPAHVTNDWPIMSSVSTTSVR